MVRFLEKYIRNTDSVRKSGEYIMKVGAGSHSRERSATLSINDIRAVAFYPGEEVEAIVLFVDTNRQILSKSIGFHYAMGFVPKSLYSQYIDYLKHNVRPYDIEPLPSLLEVFHTKKRGGYVEKTDFFTYMRQRVSPKLLQDAESLFRDRKFVNSFCKRGQKR